MSATNPPTKKYRGNCHCGAFVFELDVPEIKSVSDCDCSICHKKGYLWLRPENPPTVVKDEGTIVSYEFGLKTYTHEFCRVCGTAVGGVGRVSGENPVRIVNVRAIQNLDVRGLEVTTFEGTKLDPQYVAPQYSGPEPSPPGLGEDAKVYHGSCHCGAVTVAVKVQGSLEDGSYKGPIFECNCSICQRGGYVWIYPREEQLGVQGRENLAAYAFGPRVWRKLFCRTCGVHVLSDQNSLTDGEKAALSEFQREFMVANASVRPLNLRVINGFDIGSVTPTRVNGWDRPPAYVNP